MTKLSEMKNPTNLGGGVGSVRNFPIRGKATMNSLVKLDCNVQKMSSREIAELCNKRHDNVMADIRKMLADLGLATPEFSGVYKDQQLIDRPCFNLPKRETLILVSGYNIELRAKIIDRWAELESQAQYQPIDPMKALSDPNALRGLLLGYSEKVIELEHQVEEMQPTVEAFERIAKSNGGMCISDAAKTLQFDIIQKLFKWMHANGWIYKRAGNKSWIAHQDKVKSGYLEVKTAEVPYPDGSTKIREQVLVTPKGLTKLAKDLGKGVAA